MLERSGSCVCFLQAVIVQAYDYNTDRSHEKSYWQYITGVMYANTPIIRCKCLQNIQKIVVEEQNASTIPHKQPTVRQYPRGT